MRVRFVGQPFAESTSLYEVLTTTLESTSATQLKVVVAWAKRSGLRRISEALTTFRNRGGRAELILGIDSRGATEQGLRMSGELFDTVHVFNDPSGRTFH